MAATHPTPTGLTGNGSLITLPLLGLAALATIWLLAPRQSEAERFLRWSLGRHGALSSLHAEYRWSLAFDNAEPAFVAMRTLDYEKPNRYRVRTTTVHGAASVSICDGNRLVEYGGAGGMDPQEYPAPPTLAEAAALRIRNPMECGSPLYMLLGGPAQYDALVERSSSALTFGADEMVGEIPCRVVRFRARRGYGDIELALGAKDGLVRRIRYSSAPLVTGARQNSPNAPLPKSALTTELYTVVTPNPPLGPQTFATTPLPTPASSPSPIRSVVPSAKPVKNSDSPFPLGEIAPDFTVRTLTGRRVNLSDHRSHVVMLLFFSTKRNGSAEMLKRTEALYDTLASRGLVLMAISRERRANIRRFLHRHDLTLPIYLDSAGEAHDLYSAARTPVVAIVSPNGCLAAAYTRLPEDAKLKAALIASGLKP